MKAKQRLIVAVLVLGLLMTGPFVVTSLLVWLDMKEAERTLLTNLLVSRLLVGTMMTLFGFALGVGVLHKLFKQYVEGLVRMAETLRLMLGANRNFRVTNDLLELRNLVQTAELIVHSAMLRHESRGLHFSRDYPEQLPAAENTVLTPD